MKTVHIVFEQGCINYTSGVESVNYFPSIGKITLVLHPEYTKEQIRYTGANEDPVRIYNHSTVPFTHSFLIEDVQKMCIEE